MKKISPIICLFILIFALPLSAQQADLSKYEHLGKFDKKLDSLLNQGIDSTGLDCLFKIASDGLEVYISNQDSLHFVELVGDDDVDFHGDGFESYKSTLKLKIYRGKLGFANFYWVCG